MGVLDGKVSTVTGSNRGIARGIVLGSWHRPDVGASSTRPASRRSMYVRGRPPTAPPNAGSWGMTQVIALEGRARRVVVQLSGPREHLGRGTGWRAAS